MLRVDCCTLIVALLFCFLFFFVRVLFIVVRCSLFGVGCVLFDVESSLFVVCC